MTKAQRAKLHGAINGLSSQDVAGIVKHDAAASFSAWASNTASRRAAATSGTCAISGLKAGRPFAA